MNSVSPQKPVVLASRDLFFIAKVREVAASCGRDIVVARSEERLIEALQATTVPVVVGGVLLIDLEKSVAVPGRLAELCALLKDPLQWRVISFFSHVHGDVSLHAKELGLGEVIPRSKFVVTLPEALKLG